MAINGADVVKCLNHFKRIDDIFGQFQALTVHLQSLIKSTLVTQSFSHFAQSDYVFQLVAVLFHLML